MRVLQRSKSFHKVVHNISLWPALAILASRLLPPLLRPLPLLLLTERGAVLHGHERCAARLEPRHDPAQRLAFSALLLVFSRTEVFLAANRVGRDHRAAIGIHFKNVHLESEGVDELGRGTFHVALCTGSKSQDLRMRLRSLGEGGCLGEALPGKTSYIGKRMRMRIGKTMWFEMVAGPLLTGRGTRKLGDWISGTRDAAA